MTRSSLFSSARASRRAALSLALLGSAAMLSACGDVKAPPVRPAPPEVLTPDPAYTAQVSANDARLAGVDRDQDGTRDDLDHALGAMALEPAALASAESYVRATGQMVLGDPAGTAAAGRLQASLQLQLLGELGLTQELDSLMLNTAGRLDAFAATQPQASAALVRAPQPAGQARLAQTAPVIVFQNGIFSDEAAAAACLNDLRRLLGDEGMAFDYYINYNGTDGLKDLMEVFDFKGSEGGGYARELLRNAQRLVTDPAGFVGDLIQNLEVLRAGVGTLKDLAGGAETHSYMDTRVKELADGLEGLLAQDRAVILVPHSQGNLYAQAVTDELRARGVNLARLHVVGVATPGRGPVTIHNAVYFNSVSDQVMNGLRVLYPVAPANDGSVPPTQGEDPVLGHAFGAVYLNPKYTLAPRIKAAILEAAQPVATP